MEKYIVIFTFAISIITVIYKIFCYATMTDIEKTFESVQNKILKQISREIVVFLIIVVFTLVIRGGNIDNNIKMYMTILIFLYLIIVIFIALSDFGELKEKYKESLLDKLVTISKKIRFIILIMGIFISITIYFLVHSHMINVLKLNFNYTGYSYIDFIFENINSKHISSLLISISIFLLAQYIVTRMLISPYKNITASYFKDDIDVEITFILKDTTCIDKCHFISKNNNYYILKKKESKEVILIDKNEVKYIKYNEIQNPVRSDC